MNRRVVLGVVALVVTAVVMFAIDAAAGGKHPLAVTAVGFGGAFALIGLAVLIPGGLLARPEGTRAWELGVRGDEASSLDENDGRGTDGEASHG